MFELVAKFDHPSIIRFIEVFEDDANVSVNADGAYVQAWLWIDNNDIKVKKTTRSRKVTL
jgi:quinol monooxygenase YgiN